MQNLKYPIDSQEQPPLRNSQKGKKGSKRIIQAFFYSLDGFKAAWNDETAFRQIVILFCVFTPLGIYLAKDWNEGVLLLLPCFLALGSELINSAIENAIDFTSTKTHPLAKKAKDMGSALQLVALIFWIVVWAWYLMERFLD
ncbi:MAG: diacylglycerol kinase [Helicobacter sp.]|nr:diacylglycerol kinase [Helicobacter sp.]